MKIYPERLDPRKYLAHLAGQNLWAVIPGPVPRICQMFDRNANLKWALTGLDPWDRPRDDGLWRCASSFFSPNIFSFCSVLKIAKNLLMLLGLMLAGCTGEPQTGPAEIRYDRETCDYCRMIISDPRFAAEIRRGKGSEVFMFDDIGDAIHWLKRAGWKKTGETEFWVRDMKTGTKWLDARKVWYLPGQHSPMAYGYGAFAEKSDDAVSFEEMRKAVIAKGSSAYCDTPDLDGHQNSHTHEQALHNKED